MELEKKLCKPNERENGEGEDSNNILGAGEQVDKW